MTYLYRSNAALWWPATGEDIDVRWLPTRPGKAIQLELKTTVVAGAGFHDVWVDLGQLWEYRQLSPGRQPFYAFPWPDWRGKLTDVAKARGRAVTELAFRRSGSKWWFADWMVLLTTAEVAAVLHRELMAHGRRERGERERLVRFDLRRSTTKPVVTWGSGGVAPQVVRWREFWPELAQCGRMRWPQLIFLPARIIRARGLYQRSQVVGMLREAAATLTAGQWEDEELVALEPDQEGNYQIAPASDDTFGGSTVDEADEADEASKDHRQIVFLDARTLLRAES